MFRTFYIFLKLQKPRKYHHFLRSTRQKCYNLQWFFALFSKMRVSVFKKIGIYGMFCVFVWFPIDAIYCSDVPALGWPTIFPQPLPTDVGYQRHHLLSARTWAAWRKTCIRGKHKLSRREFWKKPTILKHKNVVIYSILNFERRKIFRKMR